MNITIICSSEFHPINLLLEQWIQTHEKTHSIELIREMSDAKGGDLLFLISCSEIITKEYRKAYTKTLVIHASDLPNGRGWSPHIWQIIKGRSQINVTLLEADDLPDNGNIWHQEVCHIPRHALWNEINDIIFNIELNLMDYAIANYHTIIPRQQSEKIRPTFFPKRTPADGEIDPQKNIAEQFDLLRVSDPNRYPAFFKLRGHIFKIQIEKINHD